MSASISPRCNGCTSSCLVLLLVLSMVSASSVQCCRPRVPDVRLDFICAEPDSVRAKQMNVPVIMLHGMTDMKETWNAIYKNLSSLTQRKVCIYDARNHGESSWSDRMGLDPMVEDLENFMNMLNIDRAVLVGHSMGGNTVMKFALRNPSKADGIVVEDIAPKMPDGTYESVLSLLKLLRDSLSAIPDGADGPTAKNAVLDYIRKVTQHEPLLSYVQNMPLRLINGEWKWKTNLEVINKTLDNTTSYFTENEGPYEGKALFIYGTVSYFRVGNQKEGIRKLFPNAEFVGIEGAGHDIHPYYPEFMQALLAFLE